MGFMNRITGRGGKNDNDPPRPPGSGGGGAVAPAAPIKKSPMPDFGRADGPNGGGATADRARAAFYNKK